MISWNNYLASQHGRDNEARNDYERGRRTER